MYRFPFICLSIARYARKYDESVCSRQGISLHIVPFFLFLLLFTDLSQRIYTYSAFGESVFFVHFQSISFFHFPDFTMSVVFFLYSHSVWCAVSAVVVAFREFVHVEFVKYIWQKRVLSDA